MAAFTNIGNAIGNQLENQRLGAQNPLNRRMFVDPSSRNQLSRGPSGILGSSPELMNAVMNAQNPALSNASLLTATGGVLPVFPEAPLTGPGPVLPSQSDLPPTFDTLPDGQNVGEDDLGDASEEPPKISPNVVADANDGFAKAKAKAKVDPKDKAESGKSKSQAALDAFTDKISELRGTKKPKTNKEALQSAKDFLKEAGVTDVDDIRTSRDFMLMNIGLNIAAGQSQDFLTNVATGGKESLATFGAIKAKEKEAERAINLAAAEMAKTEVAAEKARGQKFDEAELAMATAQYTAAAKAEIKPDDLIIAQAMVDDGYEGTLSDALTSLKSRTKTPTASAIIIDAIQKDFPNISGVFLKLLNTSGGAKQIIENMNAQSIANGLGVDATTPEGRNKVASFMGIATEAAKVDAANAGTSVVQSVDTDGTVNLN